MLTGALHKYKDIKLVDQPSKRTSDEVSDVNDSNKAKKRARGKRNPAGHYTNLSGYKKEGS